MGLSGISTNAQIFNLVKPKSGQEFEYGEIQLGINMAPDGLFYQASAEKLIGIKDRFVFPLRASFVGPAAKYRQDNEVWLQAGLGIEAEKLTTVLIYPFWFKKDLSRTDNIGYSTPISLAIKYQLPEVDRFHFELWFNWYNDKVDVNFRMAVTLTRIHNKNATAKMEDMKTH